MAVFYLRHEPIGKTTHARGTAAANARYIMRRGAASIIHAERMPWEWLEVQKFLHRHEKTSRKNARVCDKIILNLPRELERHAAFRLVDGFLREVSGGRAPYLFTIHDDKENHPHAHVIFVDRDPETGKRVFGMSTQGSTYRLRIMWENHVNAALREAGLNIEVSRWGKEHQKKVSNDNTPPQRETLYEPPQPLLPRHTASTALSPQTPTGTKPPVSQHGAEEQSVSAKALTPMEVAMQAASAFAERPYMDSDEPDGTPKSVNLLIISQAAFLHAKAALDKLKEYNAEFMRLDNGHERAAKSVTRIQAQLNEALRVAEDAEVNLKGHYGWFGRLRGFQIGSWISRRRRKALTAETALSTALRNVDSVRRLMSQWEVEREQNEAEKNQTLQKRQALKEKIAEHLRINGSEQEIASTLSLYKESINYHAEKLTPDELDRAFKAKQIDERDHARAKSIVMDLQRERLREIANNNAGPGY